MGSPVIRTMARITKPSSMYYNRVGVLEKIVSLHEFGKRYIVYFEDDDVAVRFTEDDITILNEEQN